MSEAGPEASAAPAWISHLGAYYAARASADFALRGLRVQLVVAGEAPLALTVDFTSPHPRVFFGLRAHAHATLHVRTRALAPLLAASSFRKVLPLIQDGSIRLLGGALFAILFFSPEISGGREDSSTMLAIDRLIAASAP